MARKKLRNTRPKAIFGALIGAGTTMAAAAMQAAATAAASKEQANAMLENAKRQADALKLQNENNNQLQTEMMQFTKEQNAETRRIMMENNMNNQLLAGNLATQDRREASKTVLKNGGRKRRKLRNPFLRGNNFKVSDGGIAIPDVSSQGDLIYDFVGDKHYEYHDDPNHPNSNDKLSGIGLRFDDGDEVEVEDGEKGIPTPTEFLVLSNQTFIDPSTGLPFNPSKAVDYGMPPRQAHGIQEFIKGYYGLSDDGGNKSPVKRRLRSGGGCSIPIRHRAKNGTRKEIASINNRKKASFGTWLKSNSWTVAPTISAVGNFLGAGLSSLGLGLGSRYLWKSAGQAGDLLANAYGQLQGVNMSDVFGDNARASFNTGFYMPTVRRPRVNANPQLEKAARDARLQNAGINNNTLSSAGRIKRSAMTNASLDEIRSKIYADTANREEQIKQENNQAINEAGQTNAGLMMQYLRDYTSQRADLAKFNANVANERILGAAEARANAMQAQGQIGAQMRQGIGSAFGNAFSQSGLGFSNAYNSKLIRDHELAMSMTKMNDSQMATYLGNPMNGSTEEAKQKLAEYINAADNAWTNGNTTVRDEYLLYATKIARRLGLELPDLANLTDYEKNYLN